MYIPDQNAPKAHHCEPQAWQSSQSMCELAHSVLHRGSLVSRFGLSMKTFKERWRSEAALYRAGRLRLVMMGSMGPLLFAFSICLNTPGMASKYANVFDASIYEQESVLQSAGTSITDEELDQRLEDHLYDAKRQMLESYLLTRMESKLSRLRDHYQSANDREVLDSTLGTCRSTLSAFGSSLGIFSILGPLMAGTAQYFGSQELRRRYPVGTSNGLFERIEKLEEEISDLTSGLDREPMLALETKYIWQKRLIHNQALKKEIERKLLSLRDPNMYSKQAVYKYIEDALRLPTTTTCRYDTSCHEDYADLCQAIETNPVFRNYDQRIQSDPRRITLDLANLASPSNNSSNRRRTYYLSGVPSSGKTTAAVEIAKILGFSHHSVTLIEPSEAEDSN